MTIFFILLIILLISICFAQNETAHDEHEHDDHEEEEEEIPVENFNLFSSGKNMTLLKYDEFIDIMFATILTADVHDHDEEEHDEEERDDEEEEHEHEEDDHDDHDHAEDDHSTCPTHEHWMHEADKDDDKYVSAKEFNDAFPAVYANTIQCSESTHALFEVADADHSGSITLVEFQTLLGSKGTSSEEEEEEDDHDGHNHRKRSVLETKCLSTEAVFDRFDFDFSHTWSRSEFAIATPSILVIGLGLCDETEPEMVCEESKLSSGAVWGYAIGATIIISLISVIGLVLVPFQSDKFQEHIMSPLLSFAVGTLLGDAVLHLIPTAFGLHSHSDSASEVHYIYYALTVLFGVISFFILERHIEHLYGPDDHHEHHHHDEQLSLAPIDKSSESESLGDYNSAVSEDDPASSGATASVDEEGKKHSHKHEFQNVKSVGWLNLISDMIHNFVDGVAIGAAFATSVEVGVATVIAVICHELPQELADFSILIHAGFSKRNALLLNLLTALTAMIGALLGVGVAVLGDTAARWLLAFTAGNFFYISLADMVQTLHSNRQPYATLKQLFFIIIGVLIMFALTFLEGALESDCAHAAHDD